MSDFEHARRKDLTGHPVFGVPAPDTSELSSRFPVLGCDVARGIPSTPPPTQPVAPGCRGEGEEVGMNEWVRGCWRACVEAAIEGGHWVLPDGMTVDDVLASITWSPFGTTSLVVTEADTASVEIAYDRGFPTVSDR